MNAIINLNHFCEIHGPTTIFSTQTLREIKPKDINFKEAKPNETRNCCGSIGSKVLFITEDKNSSITFVSSERNILGKDNQNLLITLKSLSCEITGTGPVYFGDSRLNSFCYSFKVKDCLSRGFEKLYSIVVIMIDKMFLLNTSTFLSQNIKEIAKQIQERALVVYEQEQRLVPQRAERLNTGKASNVAPRSLKDLTGEPNIFAFLHSSFSWVLASSSVYLTENLTLGNPSTPSMREKEIEDGFASVHIDKEDFLMQHFPLQSSSFASLTDNTFNLRALKRITASNFNQILYCSLVGVQIVIRCRASLYSSCTNYFKDFLPIALHRFIIESPTKYLPPSKAKVLVLSPDVSVPVNVFQIEFHEDHSDRAYIKCPVEMPPKLPSLMIKILNAMDEKTFSNNVLDKFVKALVEEWKNKALCLVNSHDEMVKLKRTLGIQAQDELLINYWRSAL